MTMKTIETNDYRLFLEWLENNHSNNIINGIRKQERKELDLLVERTNELFNKPIAIITFDYDSNENAIIIKAETIENWCYTEVYINDFI